jgi:hypothetical protein
MYLVVLNIWDIGGLSRNYGSEWIRSELLGTDLNPLGFFLNLNGSDRAKFSDWIPTGSNQKDRI